MVSKLVWAAALVAFVRAQSLVPAKAGLISYAEEAYIDDNLVTPTTFFVVNENSVLRVVGGRAEVLLGPCAVLWIDERSSFRMLANRLNDTRIELFNGTFAVAVGELASDRKIAVQLGNTTMPIDRKGVYRLGMSPPQVRVLAGRLRVHGTTLTPGRSLELNAGRVARFDRNSEDRFESWSNERAGLLARLSQSQPMRPPTDAPKVGEGKVRTDRILLSERNGQPRTVSGAPPANDRRPAGCVVEPWKH